MQWTREEEERLKELYQHYEHEEIGRMLGKTRNSVRTKCWRLRLRKKETEWTDEEYSILRAWYNHYENRPLHIQGLANLFGRSYAGVALKASRLGLGRQNRDSPFDRGGKRRKYETDEEMRAALSEQHKNWHRENEHPRGMKGKHHSEETRKHLSKTSRAAGLRKTKEEKDRASYKRRQTNIKRYGNAKGPMTNKQYSRARGGKRADLNNVYFRSRWEANYARYLNFLKVQGEIQSWEFEPETFVFHKIRRGTISYIPDFRIIERDGSLVYHEVKGWMDAKSKTKLKRMAKYYPSVKIVIIGETEYKEIGKWSALIPNWEK